MVPRCLHLRLEDKVLRLHVLISKFDIGFFYHMKDWKFATLTVCFIDNILKRGTNEFKTETVDSNIIELNKVVTLKIRKIISSPPPQS